MQVLDRFINLSLGYRYLMNAFDRWTAPVHLQF